MVNVASFARAPEKVGNVKATAPARQGATGLRIGPADDAFEREADRVAQTVVADSDAGWWFSRMTVDAPLRRKCDCGGSASAGGMCDECRRKEETLQRASASDQGRDVESAREVPPIVHEVLRSSGRPLGAATRAFFEPRFGADFSQVRVHTDAKAADSARSIDATAYTVGHHVVLGEGRYNPSTSAGGALLAHELTHVLQGSRVVNGAAPIIRRQAAGGDSGPPRRSLESNFVVCPEGLQNDLRDNHRAALTHVQRAVAALSGGFERMDPSDKASFRHYFDPASTGEIDDRFVRDVRENYQRIGAYMRSVRFNCDPDSNTLCGSSKKWCVDGRLMWTCFGDLHVCTDAYTSSADAKFKIDTIIHESTHNALHTTDREYSSSKDFNRLSPRGSGILSILSNIPIIGALFRLFRSNSDTLYNPDSYSGFAMHAGSAVED